MGELLGQLLARGIGGTAAKDLEQHRLTGRGESNLMQRGAVPPVQGLKLEDSRLLRVPKLLLSHRSWIALDAVGISQQILDIQQEVPPGFAGTPRDAPRVAVCNGFEYRR